MRDILNKIPYQHLGEYLAGLSSLTKKRIRLFCIMVVAVYLFADLTSYMVAPGDFNIREIRLFIFLIIGILVIIYLNRKMRSLGAIKFNAYLFIALLLFVTTRINIIYYTGSESSAALYVFTLFFFSFIIPWGPGEVIPITLMHIIAYTLFFVYVQNHIPEKAGEGIGLQAYFEGLIFISMAFILCWVLRKKETAKDVENFILLKDVESKNKQMERELELATRVHKTLIPKSMSTDLADIAVMYHPMHYIGGDYAKFHFIDEDKLIFIICDVTGHGVSAALLVNRFHAEFERSVKSDKGPGRLLGELDEFLIEDLGGIDMYISAFCGLLNFKDMKFIYSNHGHPAQYIYQIKSGEIRCLRSQTVLLGLGGKTSGIYQDEISFDKKDKILLFTDGVIETTNKKGEEYGKNRLENFIKRNYLLQAGLFNQGLLDELNLFKRGSFKDDIFILNIQIK